MGIEKAINVGYVIRKLAAKSETYKEAKMTIAKSVRLSAITTDPALAAFFERGERDSGAAFAVPASPKPVLTGGAVKAPEYA